jgi:pathogenesis-related protein 1
MREIMIACVLLGCGPMYAPPQTAQPAPTVTQEPPAGDDDPAAPTSEEGAGAPAPRPHAPPMPPAPRPSNLSAEASAFVAAHNKVRAQHCAGPLTWSAKLADAAQRWANTLRDRGCKFEHTQNNVYGENLAGGTIGALDAGSTVAMWYDEQKQYRFGSGGFSMDTGHFTQVVWRGTTQLGCGHSQCNGNDIFVCEYDPPGNYEGEYDKNVMPVGCK